ncbi:MAG: diadenylate cyclase CdaA [Bdellovibrionales bacterium]|nr:diadenylate cyclase CdaA [Bdellovibrionales bacterium]
MFENIHIVFTELRLKDFVDFLLVWIVVYRVLLLTKRAGAVQILSGMGVLAIAYSVSIWAELLTFHWLLEKFFSNLFLIVVILFQGEIRQALAQIGSNPFWLGEKLRETHVVEEVAQGAIQLAQRGIGALIVLEKDINLDYFLEVGVEIDAGVVSETLVALFQPTSPLHDGAAVIRDGRIFAAGCFLPLSKNPILEKSLGTRHRAGLGLTEETDALVLVVSEENKSVGLALGGNFLFDLSHGELRQKLYDFFAMKKKVAHG